jgi:hypothetical protein
MKMEPDDRFGIGYCKKHRIEFSLVEGRYLCEKEKTKVRGNGK